MAASYVCSIPRLTDRLGIVGCCNPTAVLSSVSLRLADGS